MVFMNSLRKSASEYDRIPDIRLPISPMAWLFFK
jgi:hypothetical protein